MDIRYRLELIKLMDDLPKVAAEIGVAEGRFSVDMLRWGLDRLYLVDAWRTIDGIGDGRSPQDWHDANYGEAKKKMEEFGDRAVILRGLSVEMAKQVPDNSLGLLYIDADHSYTGVKEDLRAWMPKVVNGGIIAGHDYFNFAGVKRAVEKYKPHILNENKAEDAGYWFVK